MNWIQAQNPALTGNPYGSTTPHQFWDGKFHHHFGELVKGMGMADKQPQDRGRKLTTEEAADIREEMKEKGITQLAIGEILDRAAGTISHVLNLKAHLHQDEIDAWKEYIASTGRVG